MIAGHHTFHMTIAVMVYEAMRLSPDAGVGVCY